LKYYIQLDTMRKVLVTGGNKGIGYAICLTLLRDHPDVSVILGSRDAARGQEAVARLRNEVPSAQDRVELVMLDTTSDESVEKAASTVKGPLYGIVNNAAVGHGRKLDETLATNYFGVRRVTDAFLPLLQSPGGRVVNVASAAGPFFVSALPDDDPIKTPLSTPWSIRREGIEGLDRIASSYKVKNEGPNAWDSYGLSKALVICYSWMLSRECPDLLVNSATPGLVKTDLTSHMPNVSKTPEEGAVPIIHCLLDEKFVPRAPQGRYYGSDCLRSPFHEYRDPGSPEYEGPED
jgi:NAD(P)-dependent dehydrogenase (short-subunit alcohol dehydrogenase family)